MLMLVLGVAVELGDAVRFDLVWLLVVAQNRAVGSAQMARAATLAGRRGSLPGGVVVHDASIAETGSASTPRKRV